MAPRIPMPLKVRCSFDRLSALAAVDKRAVNIRHLESEGRLLGIRGLHY